MGINGAFEDGEFDRMSEEPLVLNGIKHKSIIEVDKEGTVGAAATGNMLTISLLNLLFMSQKLSETNGFLK